MIKYFTPRDPNNLRNRYRRAMAAHASYGWYCHTFRDWINSLIDKHGAYSADTYHANFQVAFLKHLNVHWKTHAYLQQRD